MALTQEELVIAANYLKSGRASHLLSPEERTERSKTLNAATYDEMVEIHKIADIKIPETTYVGGYLEIVNDKIFFFGYDMHYASNEGCGYDEKTDREYYKFASSEIEHEARKLLKDNHRYSCKVKTGRLGEPSGPIVEVIDEGPKLSEEELNKMSYNLWVKSLKKFLEEKEIDQDEFQLRIEQLKKKYNIKE